MLLLRFVHCETDAVTGTIFHVLVLVLLPRRSWRSLVETDVPTDGPQVSGDQLAHVEVVLVVTEGVLDGLGDLEPTNVEDESENEEEREEDVGFVLLGLASDESEEEITPESEPDDLPVERGQDHAVERVHLLQLALEPDEVVDDDLLLIGDDSVFFGADNRLLEQRGFYKIMITPVPFNHGH